MSDLPTTFKNDVIDPTMDGRRRYQMITNSDGTVSFVDVTTYAQIGSPFGADEINAQNEAINQVNENLKKLESKVENVGIKSIQFKTGTFRGGSVIVSFNEVDLNKTEFIVDGSIYSKVGGGQISPTITNRTKTSITLYFPNAYTGTDIEAGYYSVQIIEYN